MGTMLHEAARSPPGGSWRESGSRARGQGRAEGAVLRAWWNPEAGWAG